MRNRTALLLGGWLAAGAALADVPPLSGFLSDYADASADGPIIRLENRTNTTTVARAVCGVQTVVSADGVSLKEWDTTSVENGWRAMPSEAGEANLLVLNPPEVIVHGGRLDSTSNVVWSSGCVHFVRNRVIVPSGIRLTIAEGAIVKFGESSGITVESGGYLTLAGRTDRRTYLTSIADDLFGGDTDYLATNAVYSTWSISGSGTIDSYYTHIRYGTVSALPTVGLAATSVTALQSEGKARIYVSVSGTRSNRFSLHWRSSDGTAKYGEDFTQNEGEVEWPNTSGSLYYFEIPLMQDEPAKDVRHFTVEIFSTEDCNVNPSALTVDVSITPLTAVPEAVCCASDYSDAVRLENRAEGTVGKALSHGTEWKSANGAARAVVWNTTAEADGWKSYSDDTNTVQTLVRNDASITHAGGRLAADETWTDEQTHLVRNRVIVPSGVTLTVTTNAIIKFCEGTGIEVLSGGSLVVASETNAPAIFTSVFDDTVGGDTDMQERPATNDNAYTISVSSGSYVADAGAVFRQTTVSALPTISIASTAEINESDEQVRIPISVSGTRTAPFLIHWRVSGGTAEYGTDYTIREGVLTWSSTSDASQYIIIPVVDDGVAEETETLVVELYDAQSANVSRSAYRCTVTVRDSTATYVPVAVCTNSEYSAFVRLENRAEGTAGRAVVCGTEWASSNGLARAELWDTTAEADGWREFNDGSNTAMTLIRNDASVALVGGRMAIDETWTADSVHIVRNRVFVPSGVTLTVMTNAVVKFCENTGITVESGGRLVVAGSADEPVVFTSIADDTVGGDADMRDCAPTNDLYTISASSSYYSSSEGAVFRYTTFSTLPTVSITSGCEVNESDEQVKVSISVSGTRSAPFRLFWRAVDGTAEYGTDYTLASGVIDWSTSSDATKYIVIPIANDGVLEESERFTIELYEAQNANVSRSAGRCTVTIRDSTPTYVPVAVCTNSEYSAFVRLENRAEGTLAKALVHGTEWKSLNAESRAVAWDSTAEEDGWKEYVDGTDTVRTLVRNDPSIAVVGGRMATNETWTAEQTYLVRNWVIIPSGVTLTITTNAVVKFCEETGISVLSGGTLNILGTLDENVIFTTAADDSVAGDADMRTVAPSNGWYSISVSGTRNDDGLAMRYYTYSSLPTVSVTADLVVDASEGIVRLPVSVSGTSRTRPFSVDWTTSLGGSGRIVWNASSEGTKWLTFPVSLDTPDFTFNLVNNCECNIGSPAITHVDLYSNVTENAVCTNSAYSAFARLETRDMSTSYAAPLVTGVQPVSDAAGEYHRDWNTSDTEDGWRTVDCGGGENATLWIVNDPSISVQGGRLETDTTWTADKLWLVRNWVIIPSGVTLTIEAGAVVKFCDATGISVLSGGKLVCAGTESADVVLTSVHDDTAGGDTDGRDVTPMAGGYSITSSGTFTDTNTSIRYGTSGTFGTVSTTAQVVGKKRCGHVLVPVFISASRSTPFAVDWVAEDGTAMFGEDYLTASGRVTWASSSAGTQYIDIPLDPMSETAESEYFTVKLTYGRGINLSTGTISCKVLLYDTVGGTFTGENVGFASADWSNLAALHSDAGVEPLFVYEDEPVRYSTKWAENGVGVRVTETDLMDSTATLVGSESATEGTYIWHTAAKEDGRYELQHVITDALHDGVLTNESTFIVNRDVMLHAGTLTGDETWTTDYVHLVTATVTVPSGVTLTIQPGAVVKFKDGAGIVVKSGGSGIAKGTVFTHASDDTVGGDTFFDGDVNAPKDGKYTLSGSWTTDAATQRRYQSAITVGGTISTNSYWAGHQTYKVTSSVVVAAGVTLEIGSGAVLKFASSNNSSASDVVHLTVNSNATLRAIGTYDEPIVFTSVRDDLHGDTNGDGTNTVAAAGDWPRIYANGTVEMSYCHILYCNQSTGRGAIEGVNGNVTFDNSRIQYSMADCVKMSGGTFVAHNSVFREADAGLGATTGATVRVYNSLIAECGTACRGLGKEIENTVFYGCETFFETNGNVCVASVFHNPPGTGVQADAFDVGESNRWADPLFSDYLNGDYTLLEDSPCIDAGTSVFSTTQTDYVGRIRVVNGILDIGPCEYQTDATTHSMVKFDLGLYGVHTGGGALVQTILNGEAAVEPEFRPVDGWYFTQWDGDFTSVTNNVTITAQWARVPCDVLVSCTRGQSAQDGTNVVYWGDAYTLVGPEPVVYGTTQYVCRGASDYQPLSTNFTITVTNDLAVTWDIWATNYWLAVDGAEESLGSVTGNRNAWLLEGATTTLTAKPNKGVFFMGWSGDTNGCTVGSTTIQITMDRARSIRAVFKPLAVDVTTATETVPFVGRILLDGARVTLTCEDGGKMDSYTIERGSSSTYSAVGSGMGLTGDDVYGSYTLPFDFPFYGKTYRTVYPNSNGALFMTGGRTDTSFNQSTFDAYPMIAVLWRDLKDGNVYVSQSSEYVTFRWSKVYYSGGASVNASVTLYKTGVIKCSYGSGNSNGGGIGISSGAGTTCLFDANTGTGRGNVNDILFVPTPSMPEWLTLTEDGTLSGTPMEAGTYGFTVSVTDADGRQTLLPVEVTVQENANKRPVVASHTPSVGTVRVHAGTNEVFSVAASDPNGDDLTYIWTLDGVEKARSAASNYVFNASFATHGSHTLSCAVTDGLWTMDAGEWRVDSTCDLYVDAEAGSDARNGFSPSTAKRTLQTAIWLAMDGETIYVAEGIYEPVITSNKQIRVIATGAVDKTVIDGGGTNRCVYAGDVTSETNSWFTGFMIRNGYVEYGGAGVRCGRFDNCIIKDSVAGNGNWYGGGAWGAVLNNCLIVGNNAYSGGGADSCILNGCTVVSNTSSSLGGGTYACVIRNTIVWDNIVLDGNERSNTCNSVSISHSCIGTDSLSGDGYIIFDPWFTDAENGDYRLRQYSPCLNAGNNAYVVGESDLAGTNRIIEGTVDMGAFEGWVYLPVPTMVTNVVAENGRRVGIVRLTWLAEAFSHGYAIYRAASNDRDAAEKIGTAEACFYDDTTAEPETEYWYWIAGVNPTGEGPVSAAASGSCLGEMVLGENALAAGQAGVSYSAQLSVSGGSGAYKWKSGADNYDAKRQSPSYLLGTAEPVGLVSVDDDSISCPLPFDFPFYGKTYNKLWVSSNGTLTFDGAFKTCTPNLTTFTNRVIIAPFWTDLNTGSAGVRMSVVENESVTFYWSECTYRNGSGSVNVSATLFADGTITFSYGDGNAAGAYLGISAGDGRRYSWYAWQTQRLANADDLVFAPQTIPAGLTLSENGAISGKPKAPGSYTFSVLVTDDLGNAVMQTLTLDVAVNENLLEVRFDLGDSGTRAGGGDLIQYVAAGEDADAPAVRVRSGLVFDSWTGSYTNVTGNTVVTANYRSAYVDLHVDSVSTPQTVCAGETLTVSWTVGNTGNPTFNGTMTERIMLVSATSDEVSEAKTVTFEGIVARDGTTERSATFTVPLKGWDGTWHVRVETAVNPSMRDAGGDNTRTAEQILSITPVPLPDLIVDEISAPNTLVPGESVTVSFRERNTGAGDAVPDWTDGVWLESMTDGTTVKLGSVVRNEELKAEAMASLTSSFVLPEQIALAGAVRVKILGDVDDDVVESDESNVAYGAEVLSLATNLYLSAASASVKENLSSGVRFTVKRSGPTAEPMTVTLSATLGGGTASTVVDCPATVTIPAGNASTIFYVKPIDNTVVDGSRTVGIAATSGTCRPAALDLTILDNEVPKLTVTLDKTSIREGGGVILATVTRELVTDQPLTVYLNGVSASRCTYPSSVVIPANEASVTFEIAATDDDIARIAEKVTLRASTSGYTSATVSYDVEDDDIPGVTLEMLPGEVSEGAGAQAIIATLTRSDLKQIKNPVTVKLSASAGGQLLLPASVTIPAYTMAARFAIGVVDNGMDDGDRVVTVTGAILVESCGCSGQPSNGDVIQGDVVIYDNDGPSLSLRAEPTTMKEGCDVAGYLVLSHNSTLAEDMLVTLQTDIDGELEVDSGVVIPAGQREVLIPVRTLDDGIEDGGQIVSVYADDAGGVFASGSTWVQVSDQNLPDFIVDTVELASSTVVGSSTFEVSFDVVNVGFNSRGETVPFAVYFVTGNSVSLGDAQVVKRGVTQNGLGVDEGETVTVSVTAPERPGSYRIAVVVDPQATISELDEANNTSWSSSITVSPSYTARVEVRKTAYLPGERVFLDGVATMADGRTPAAHVPVEVYVLNSSYRRTYTVTTDAEGRFTAEFLPVSGEGDHYVAGASYPNISATAAQCSFDIMGLRRTSSSHLEFDLTVGATKRLTAQIKNLSSIPLTNVRISHGEPPEDFAVDVSVADGIPEYGVVSVPIDVTALVATPETVSGYRKLWLYVTSDEGVSLSFPIYVIVREPRIVTPTPQDPTPVQPQPQIRMSFSPNSLTRAMSVGETQYVSVELVNNGVDATGEIVINVPTASWLKLMNAKTLAALAPGERQTVTLELSPTEALTLNAPITGTIQAKENRIGANVKLPFSFTPVSDRSGRLKVFPKDEYTYYQAGEPHVTGAYVRVSNPYTDTLVASGRTDETGAWLSGELPCGTYKISVSADQHSGASAHMDVEPGGTALYEPFLTYNAVTYSWDVKRVEVEDTYEIELVADFVTSVPKPTVVLDVPGSIPKLNEGESYTFNLTAANHGLIAAQNVRFAFPADFPYSYEFASESIAEIPAKSSVTVPVRVYLPKPQTPQLMSSSPRLLAAEDVTPPGLNEMVYNPCSYGIMAMFEYICGSDIRQEVARSASIQVLGLACDAVVSTLSYLAQNFPAGIVNIGGDPTPASNGGTGGGGIQGTTTRPQTQIDDWLDRLNELPPYSQDYVMTNCVMGLKLLECLASSAVGDFPFTSTLGAVISTARYGIEADPPIQEVLLGDLYEAGKDLLPDTLHDLIDEYENLEDFLTNGPIDSLPRIRNYLLRELRMDDACVDATSYYLDVFLQVEEEEVERRRRLLDGGTQSATALLAAVPPNRSELDSLCPPEMQEDAAVVASAALALSEYVGKVRYVLGGETAWDDDATVIGFVPYMRAAIGAAQQRQGVLAGRLAAFGEEEVAVLRRYTSVQPSVSSDAIDAFVVRWNVSVAHYDAGKFCAGDLMPEDAQDFIDMNVLNAYQTRIDGYAEIFGLYGYETLSAALDEPRRRIQAYLNEKSGDVCARVTLQFNQMVGIAREAFEGTLTLFNGNATMPMRDVRMTVSVTDAEGNFCNSLFGITENGLTGFDGASIFSDGVNLAANRSGVASILFVPTVDAAPTEAKLYYFGGALTYVDPVSGNETHVTLAPVPLLVNPCPRLTLHYFLQQEVFGDDPSTTDIVEASEPAEMALLVVNEGGGAVRNMTVSAVQPEKFINEKGLAVDFRLGDYEVAATAVNGTTGGGILQTDLGSIPAGGGTAQAQWWLLSSLQGRFTGMKAEFRQVNDWGNSRTCLIDETKLHALVKGVDADGSGKPDYLVCEEATSVEADTLYLDDGTVMDVHRTLLQCDGVVSGRTASVVLAFDADETGAWYGVADDPGCGRYTVTRVQRADGSDVSANNVWLRDRSINDRGAPEYGNTLHLFDVVTNAGWQVYHLTLTAKSDDVPAVEDFEGVVSGAVESEVRDAVTVLFASPIAPETFTVDDLALICQGEPVQDLSSLTVEPLDDTGRRFRVSGLAELCSVRGMYELTVMCTGIVDVYGDEGFDGRSVVWVYAGAEAPYVLTVEGVPEKPVSSLGELVLVSSSAVTIESVRQTTFTLNGDDVTGKLRVEAIDNSGTRFSICGVDELVDEDGDCELVIDGACLRNPDGLAGIGTYSVRWLRDTLAPTLVGIDRVVGFAGERFSVVFSERTDGEPLSARGLSLARDGNIVELPPTAIVAKVEDGAYEISGLDAVTRFDGHYVLTVDAAGVADVAGNVAVGTKAVSWTVDTTPPEQVADLAVSSRYGSVDTCVYLTERELTISGNLSETGLAVGIFARYAGGGETLLVTADVEECAFEQMVTLPGDGNVTVVVRVTDAAGNYSDTEFAVYVDVVVMVAELSGTPEPGEPAGVFTITFSAVPEEDSVLAAGMSLTLDGEAIAIPNVSIAKAGDNVYEISGLAEYTAGYGTYVFTYDASCVKKAASGLSGASEVSLSWENYQLDITPPTITEILFDGSVPAPTYQTDRMFSEISVRFSEEVNVPELIARGIASQAFTVQILSDANEIVGAVGAGNVEWDANTLTATWTLDDAAVPCGKARLVVDPSLVKDGSGNSLAVTEAYETVSGAKSYTPSVLKRDVAHSYACPALYDWNNDGLLDLIVGEKTADAKGKVRIYLNRGTTTNPMFNDYTYLKKGDEEVTFEAQGCVGMQVSFGRLPGATMILASSQGEIYGWRHRTRRSKEYYDWELWFDHSTDTRFASLIRTQTFCCDIDGDGVNEVIVSGQNTPMFWMKRVASDGDVPRTECTPLMDVSGVNLQFPKGQNHTSAVLTDVSGDAVPDLVTGDTAGNVWVYLGAGDTRFAAMPILLYENTETTNKRSRLAVGDINGDGVEDLLVGRQDGSVLLLRGEATLAPALNFRRMEIKSVEQALNEDIYWVDGAKGWVCEQSGEEVQATVTHDSTTDVTVLAARFTGAGTVAFTWSVTGKDDAGVFRCAGGDVEIVKNGVFTSVAQAVTVSTEGNHEIVWTFAGKNKAVVRDVTFTPFSPESQYTKTSEVPIPFADIRKFAKNIWKAKGGDYEAVVHEVSANGRSVMANCIAGLNASDPLADFLAKISYDGNRPKISWVPALNGEIDGEGVQTGVRIYTIFGARDIRSGVWEVVTPENRAEMRFFKVTVSMP